MEGFYYIFEEGEGGGGGVGGGVGVGSFFLNSHVGLFPQPPANGLLGL